MRLFLLLASPFLISGLIISEVVMFLLGKADHENAKMRLFYKVHLSSLSLLFILFMIQIFFLSSD